MLFRGTLNEEGIVAIRAQTSYKDFSFFMVLGPRLLVASRLLYHADTCAYYIGIVRKWKTMEDFNLVRECVFQSVYSSVTKFSSTTHKPAIPKSSAPQWLFAALESYGMKKRSKCQSAICHRLIDTYLG